MDGNLAYREERQQELINGHIVMMAPASVNHNSTSFNIAHIFKNYLKGKKCKPFADGTSVYLSKTDHFIPDMMVVCDRDKIKPDGVHGAPDLVVEVLSYSTAKNDRTHKKDVYGKCGVREYWLVSPAEQFVEVYRTNGTELVLHDIYTRYPEWGLRDLSEEKKAALVTHFKCSLFDDLDIYLEDIFEDLLP